jgi:hypothetical protein
MKIKNIGTCKCGHITVTTDIGTYTMLPETFERIFGFSVNLTQWFGCNGCDNNWSLEMCACGSGEPYKTCDGGFEECGRPMQVLCEGTGCVE